VEFIYSLNSFLFFSSSSGTGKLVLLDRMLL